MFENLSPWMNAGLMAAAAALVWWAGGRLARHADELARKIGLDSALMGVVLLGGMTSLPEATVAVTATLNGAPLLTVNDILGSAAINVLILAVADAVYGRKALTATPGNPHSLLQGTLSALVLLMVPAAVIAGDRLVFGVGGWSWGLLVAYAVALWMVSNAKGSPSWVPDPQGPPAREAPPAEPPADSTGRLASRIGLMGLAIMGAGYVLAESAQAIAAQSGLGESFVGAVLLGFATSLPEVSTVVAAVRMKRYAMAIGDVFGTNLFNVIILVLVDALHDGPPVLPAAGAFAAFAALMAAAMTLVFVVGLIERRDRTIGRIGLDAAAAIAIYIGGLFMLYHLR
jgi:cation:H+ antiporter